MPSFEVTGRGRESGRPRKRAYVAISESLARQLAEDDGTIVDGISELPSEPPTERQVHYARSLGIKIPGGASSLELSDLIFLKVDGDMPSSEQERDLARNYGIEVTKFIGKASIFDRIQTVLVSSGREMELVAWFTFRVYRDLVNHVDAGPIQDPGYVVVKEISEKVVGEEKIIKSIRRYEGRELVRFGRWTAPDGQCDEGGSRRTAAFIEVSSMLKERIDIPTSNRNSEMARRQSGEAPRGSQRGCLFLVGITLFLPLGIAATLTWL
jgi:hypothetical protein